MSVSASVVQSFLDLFLQEVKKEIYTVRLTNYVAFIGYTILVWDHVISFADEVRYMWRGSKGTIFYLFLINRYFTPLAFIGNLAAYLSHWDPEECKHFVRYEGSCTTIALEVTALMMFHRVYALYNGEKLIIWSLAALLALETAIMAWLMTHGIPVTHSQNVYACTMIFDPSLGDWASLSAWFPLLYDTIVIALTLWKCVPRVRNKGMNHIAMTGHIIRTLVKDGIMYYSVIFSINFVLAIMIMTAEAPLKNITAQIEQLLTVAMMSRITISLRREAEIARVGAQQIDDFYLGSIDTSGGHREAGISNPGSKTAIHHISVIPRSYRSSLQVGSNIGRHQDTLPTPYPETQSWGPQRAQNAFTRFLSNNFSSNRLSLSLGAVDTVLSISPAHTEEAIEAERQRELAIATEREHDFSRDIKVPIVSENEPLAQREAYELRTLRPSTTKSESFLPFYRT